MFAKGFLLVLVLFVFHNEKSLVDWLDRDGDVADEHFALPKSIPKKVLVAVTIVCLIACSVFLLLALGLSIEDLVVNANGTSANTTCG
jgi:hypothetical protein